MCDVWARNEKSDRVCVCECPISFDSTSYTFILVLRFYCFFNSFFLFVCVYGWNGGFVRAGTNFRLVPRCYHAQNFLKLSTKGGCVLSQCGTRRNGVAVTCYGGNRHQSLRESSVDVVELWGTWTPRAHTARYYG